MRRLVLLCFLFLSAGVYAKPKVFFNYKVFYTPDQSAYVTTHLQFAGGSFKYQAVNTNDLVTTVEITQIFKQNDTIVLADKYELDSPVMRDSIVDDFFDIQNYGLEPGIYDFELIIKDLVSGEEVSGKQSIKVGKFEPKNVMFSDISFIQSASKSEEKNNFVKNGLLLLPYMTTYYPPEMEKIAFYTEVYNSKNILGDSSKFLLTYSISNYDNERLVEDAFHFQRLSSAEVVPVVGYLPITKIPSGDYYLNLNVIDKNNDTISSESVFFQRRSDKITSTINVENVEIDAAWVEEISADSIHYFLGASMQIAPRYEYESMRKLLKTEDTLKMQKYFYAFWKKTAPLETARAWFEFRKSVYYTEELFGTQIKYGWETDRGRIWLKYGAPDQFIDRPNESSAYPYQIWHYYRIGQRSDIRFVFYNPDLVTNDYPLLHSDMQGELQNYRWQNDLHKRDSQNFDLDNPGGSVQYGGNANLYYNEIDNR